MQWVDALSLFRSLGSRVAALGCVIGIALAALGALLIQSTTQVREGFAWVAHTQQVLQNIAEPVDELRRAESDLRGTIISGDATWTRDIETRLTKAERGLARLWALTADDPLGQQRRARSLQQAVAARAAHLREGLRINMRAVPTAEGLEAQRARESRRLMAEVDRQRAEMIAHEQAKLADRLAASERHLHWNRRLVLVGGAIVGAVILLMSMLVVRSLRQPILLMLKAMERLGSGDTSARIAVEQIRAREFRKLAWGYNDMVERLDRAVERQRHSDEELQTINLQLRARSDALHARSGVVEQLSAMAHRMHAANTDEELAEVIECFVPDILPNLPGAIYAHNNSRNRLVRVAAWGELRAAEESFGPGECWALRLGQSHIVSPGRREIRCKHLGDAGEAHHCEPLLAGGEVIGSIYLMGVVDAEDRFRLGSLAENIASALLNHRLRRNLREQTIRDPLTNLFNRRYLEEALSLEVTRAARARSELTLVMCDVDHFKRFNDEFGHDAGDHVLQTVAAEMRNQFRDGDIVCRFGGEEFTIIAPGVNSAMLAPRIERLRLAIANLQLRHGQRALGPVSMSFGLADFAGSDVSGPELILRADEALYRAKREGRNRAVLAERAAA
jgi:diguanylate cyclase (GGDEF)-like protein